MARFVLVHGSWHGAWCWSRLSPCLEALGHQPIAFDLPGSGADPAPPAAAGLDGYARRTEEVLGRVRATGGSAGPVILVGHSLGGLTASAVAEAAPDLLDGLVYLTAMLLPDGISPVGWRAGKPATATARARVMAEDGTSTLPPEAAKDCFYGDCTAADAAWAAAQLGPQAMRLYDTAVAVSPGRWGRLPRWYIHCARDVAIVPAEQQRMVAAAPGTRTLALDAAHSPMLSRPVELAGCLDRVAAALA